MIARSWLRSLLPRLGGAQPALLSMAQVDGPEMSARGLAAMIPAIFACFAATVAFRYAYLLPLAAAASIGVGWGLIILMFDVALMSAAPGRSRAAQALTYGARGAVSLLAALTFAGPLVLFMFGQDIGFQLKADQQAELAAYNRQHIVPLYAAPLSTATAAITAGQQQLAAAAALVATWTATVGTDQVQATCEAGGVSGEAGCQHGSGRIGHGPVYAVRLAELANARASLTAVRARAAALSATLTPQLRALRAKVAGLQAAEQASYQNARARYDRDSGLIARARALAELERGDSLVSRAVELLTLLIITIDLTAVLSRISSHAPSYERVLQAERRKILLCSAMAEEDAADRHDRQRADREADTEIHQAEADARVDIALAEIQARAAAAMARTRGHRDEAAGPDDARPDATRDARPRAYRARAEKSYRGQDAGAGAPAEPVHSMTFAEYVRTSRPHERLAAPMAPALTAAAWTGLGLTTALAAGLATMAPRLAGPAWIAAAFAAAMAGLALSTRGFLRGPVWAQRAALAAAVAGLVLPPLILLHAI